MGRLRLGPLPQLPQLRVDLTAPPRSTAGSLALRLGVRVVESWGLGVVVGLGESS